VSSGGANDPGTLQQLPFTGFDLWFVAAGGLLLGLAGVALRRAVKSPATPREVPPNR
jgi:LPXTG-motif cell wall-anchored protein